MGHHGILYDYMVRDRPLKSCLSSINSILWHRIDIKSSSILNSFLSSFSKTDSYVSWPCYISRLQFVKPSQWSTLRWRGCSTSHEICTHFVIFCLCFAVASHVRFIYVLQGYVTTIGAIVRLPRCQWRNAEVNRSHVSIWKKITASQNKTKHNKTVNIFCET